MIYAPLRIPQMVSTPQSLARLLTFLVLTCPSHLSVQSVSVSRLFATPPCSDFPFSLHLQGVSILRPLAVLHCPELFPLRSLGSECQSLARLLWPS